VGSDIAGREAFSVSAAGLLAYRTGVVGPPGQLGWIEYAEVEIYVTRRPKCLKRRFYTDLGTTCGD
jgi:hypothetical protein